MKTIKIPSKTTILAEETGIHIGDGSMCLYKKNGKIQCYYNCAFNATEDISLAEHFEKLMLILFNLTPSYKRIQKNTLVINYCYKKLIEHKIKLELPNGPKNNIKIPNWIMKNKKFQYSCIRGIMDTDGSVKFQKKNKRRHYYPVFGIASKSKPLIKQISRILNSANITNIYYLEKSIRFKTETKVWKVQISGIKNLYSYINLIGFSNQKHNEKIRIWEKYGFCPPYLTIIERKNILQGKINPCKIYEMDAAGGS